MSLRILFLVASGVLIFTEPAQAQELGTQLVVNGGAETGDTTGWESGGIDAFEPDSAAAGFGEFVFTGNTGPATQTLEQEIDVSKFAAAVDSQDLILNIGVQLQARTGGGTFDSATASFSFLDSDRLEIQTITYTDDFDNEWDFYGTTVNAPFGTRFLSILLTTTRNAGSLSDGHFDEVSVIASLPGDMNCDGAIDLLDVAAFVEVLSAGTFTPKADINEDGVVDLLDVAPFVDLLTGG
ncbi:MAG: dockerin type I domain-containing protein [Planctomycetota bacterium]